MKAKYSYVAALVVVALSGCSTMSANEAVVPLQAETAKIVGLASSDELTVTDVQANKPEALGGQELSYTATTTKGRVFHCTATMMPGLLASPPTVTAPSCTPVRSHF
jgi:hypothetical protein